MIIEHWDSEEIFTGPHMQTPHMQAFLKRAEAFLDGVAQFEWGAVAGKLAQRHARASP